MSRIVVIGGHGKVALLLTPILAELGHSVTSVIRNPDHAADVEAAGAAPHVADVEMLDTDGIAEVLAGHDAVVWSAGAGGGAGKFSAVIGGWVGGPGGSSPVTRVIEEE